MLIEKTGNSGFKRGCQKTRWPTSSVGLVFFWFAKLVCDFFKFPTGRSSVQTVIRKCPIIGTTSLWTHWFDWESVLFVDKSELTF